MSALRRLLASFGVAIVAALPGLAQPTAPQAFQLKNGLRVILVEDHDHPSIHLQLSTSWPVGPELRRKARLGPLVLRLLDHCPAGHRTREAFNRAVEERGLKLSLSDTPDGPTWDLYGGSAEIESAFGLLADSVCRPFVQGSDLEDQRVRFFHAIHTRTPREAAQTTFMSFLDRPDLPTEPITEIKLSQIYLDDVQDFIGETLRPGRGVLAISGDLNLNQARQLVQTHFGTWPEGQVSAPLPVGDALPRPPVVSLSDLPSTTLALPFHPSTLSQRASMELLGLWLPRRLGEERCHIYLGAADWCSLLLLSAVVVPALGPAAPTPPAAPAEALKAELRALRVSGLGATDLDQARQLWIAHRHSLWLRPSVRLSLLSKEALRQQTLDESDITSLDLAAFNATLLAWLNVDGARELSLVTQLPPPPQISMPKREAKSK